MAREHPEAYSPTADFRISVVRLRDQITSRAKTVLLVLLAASALVFIIACSNAANLILARTVRRESELAIRAALGASTGSLRWTLLAGARPMVAILARYASRFSGPRACNLSFRKPHDPAVMPIGSIDFRGGVGRPHSEGSSERSVRMKIFLVGCYPVSSHVALCCSQIEPSLTNQLMKMLFQSVFDIRIPCR